MVDQLLLEGHLEVYVSDGVVYIGDVNLSDAIWDGFGQQGDTLSGVDYGNVRITIEFLDEQENES